MKLFKRVDKVPARHDATEEPAEPPHIHNPDKGTRWHYLDPATGKPVCKASGTRWAGGDGGLKPCGLCPYMWAQRQAVIEQEAS